LNTCEYLETKGYEVTYLDVDHNGLISLDELRNSIIPNTSMICVMYVNNEIGVIQDIPKIGEFARSQNIAFFCDATQAIGKVPVDIEEDNIDLLCFSGHKMNGPKGIGALFVKNGIKLNPLIHGGGQEKGLRGGTYNTPLIVGFGEACRLAKDEYEVRLEKLQNERQGLIDYYEGNEIGSINFKDVRTAPHILSITLKNQDAEDYLLMNAQNFVGSTGSACGSAIIDISHVIKSLGINSNLIRISIS
jgi:cysteine desulfurase